MINLILLSLSFFGSPTQGFLMNSPRLSFGRRLHAGPSLPKLDPESPFEHQRPNHRVKLSRDHPTTWGSWKLVGSPMELSDPSVEGASNFWDAGWRFDGFDDLPGCFAGFWGMLFIKWEMFFKNRRLCRHVWSRVEELQLNWLKATEMTWNGW